MDDIELIEMWLIRRDWLIDSVPYTAPEELPSLKREIQRSMMQVIVLMGKVEWKQA